MSKDGSATSLGATPLSSVTFGHGDDSVAKFRYESLDVARLGEHPAIATAQGLRTRPRPACQPLDRREFHDEDFGEKYTALPPLSNKRGRGGVDWIFGYGKDRSIPANEHWNVPLITYREYLMHVNTQSWGDWFREMAAVLPVLTLSYE